MPRSIPPTVRILGLSQSVHSLERSNRQLATAVPAFWAAQPVPPAAAEGEVVVGSSDGKGVAIRGAALTPTMAEPLRKCGPKPGRKKMALVGAVYTVDRHVRTPKAVLEALFAEPGAPREKSTPARPKPCGKRLRTSLERDAAGRSKPAHQEIFSWIAQEVRARNPGGQKPVLFLNDGQESLWKAGLTHLPEDELSIIECLDLLHVCGYVW